MCCRLQIEITFIIPYTQERDTDLCLYQCGYYPRYWVNCTVNLSYLFQQVRSVTYHLPVIGCVLKQTMMEDKAGSHMWKICWTYNVSDVGETNKHEQSSEWEESCTTENGAHLPTV